MILCFGNKLPPTFLLLVAQKSISETHRRGLLNKLLLRRDSAYVIIPPALLRDVISAKGGKTLKKLLKKIVAMESAHLDPNGIQISL